MDLVHGLPQQVREFVERRLGVPVTPRMARLVGLKSFMDLVKRSSPDDSPLSPDELIAQILVNHGIRIHSTSLSTEDELTTDEPLIVVANHPHGVLDGMLILQHFAWTGRASKMVTTVLAGGLRAISSKFILVDPYTDHYARRHNVKPAREMMEILQRKGLLAVFPAGAVSYMNWRTGRAHDQHWNPDIIRLAKRTNARIVPVYIGGGNSMLFHLVDALATHMRSTLLIREFLWKRGSTIPVVIGKSIPYCELSVFPTDEDAVDFVQEQCTRLAGLCQQ